jgi:hypothetical protein
MELTPEQKSLALDVLGLALAYCRGDIDGFDILMNTFAVNDEFPSVVASLLGHYVTACTAIGIRDGLTADQVIERAHRAIVGRDAS